MHALNFREKGKNVDHGMIAPGDGALGQLALAESFLILRMTKFSAEYPHLVKRTAQTIDMRAPSENDPRDRNRKLLGYLRGNEDRCAVCQIGKGGDIGLLSAFPEATKQRYGCDGYLCYLLTTSATTTTTATITSPAAAPVEPVAVGQTTTDSPSPSPQKITGVKRGSEQLAAMKHYNENLHRDRSTRHVSLILHLRNLNNCVKSHLINYGVKSSKQNTVAILDLGCGMGGDILKWMKGNFVVSKYVGVDIAKASLEQFAGERLKNNPMKERVTHLICADLGTESLTSSENKLETHTWEHVDGKIQGKWQAIPSPLSANADLFNVASCQFAMHYMFQFPDKADHFFSEVSRHLVPGGIFVATTIDSRVVVDMAMEVEACSVRCGSNGKARKTGTRSLNFRDDFGNVLLDMKFDSSAWDRMLLPTVEYQVVGERSEHGQDDWAYGIQYVFQLRDTGEASAVNAPEWLVPLGPPLERLAARHGLRVKLCKNFHQVVCDDFEKGALATDIHSNLGKFGVFNYKQTMTQAEWQLAHLYVALVFEKL